MAKKVRRPPSPATRVAAAIAALASRVQHLERVSHDQDLALAKLAAAETRATHTDADVLDLLTRVRTLEATRTPDA